MMGGKGQTRELVSRVETIRAISIHCSGGVPEATCSNVSIMFELCEEWFVENCWILEWKSNKQSLFRSPLLLISLYSGSQKCSYMWIKFVQFYLWKNWLSRFIQWAVSFWRFRTIFYFIYVINRSIKLHWLTSSFTKNVLFEAVILLNKKTSGYSAGTVSVNINCKYFCIVFQKTVKVSALTFYILPLLSLPLTSRTYQCDEVKYLPIAHIPSLVDSVSPHKYLSPVAL